MPYLIYGNLAAQVQRVIGWDTETVFDPSGVDRLYQRHTISLELLVGYGSDAYRKLGGVDLTHGAPFGPVVRAIDASAVESITAIRHILSLPRQQLVIWEQSSPFNTAEPLLAVSGFVGDGALYPKALDAAAGPKPLESPSILSVHGHGNTALVRWTVEVCQSECATAQPILSHRWTTSIAYDRETESLQRRMAGLVVFRADGLDQLGLFPDLLRPQILPPPPLNCRRQIDDLTLSPDGLSMEYVVTDVELLASYQDYPFDVATNQFVPNAEARQIASVDVVAERSLIQPNVSNEITGVIDDLVQLRFSGLSDEEAKPDQPGPNGAAKPKGNNVTKSVRMLNRLGQVLTAIRATNRILPRYVERASATVQGTREASLAQMQSVAFALVSGVLDYKKPAVVDLFNGNFKDVRQFLRDLPRLLQEAKFAILPPASVFTLRWSPTRKTVEVDMEVEYSGLVDHVFGGQLDGKVKMLSPLKDGIVGGYLPFSLSNVVDAIGFSLTRAVVDDTYIAQLKQFTHALDEHNRRLVYTADGVVRNLGDGISRSAADRLINFAQVLLAPCQRPPQPWNLYAAFDTEERGGPPNPPPGTVIISNRPPSYPPSPPPPPPSLGGSTLTGSNGGDSTGAYQGATIETRKADAATLVDRWRAELGLP